MRKIVKGTSPKMEKEIAIFEVQDDGNFKCYSIKDKYFTITKEQMNENRKNQRTSKYMLIKKNEIEPELKHVSIKKQCKIITKEADKLKIITGGKINLYKTGSVGKTSLQLFYDLSEYDEAEEIETYEVDILERGKGAMIWGIKYKGYGYKYDFVSHYPSIMRSPKNKFPIGKGELKHLTKEEFEKLEFYQFGMYHCHVRCIDKRVFRESAERWYSHIELNYVRIKLKWDITLVDDGEPNFLHYDSSKLVSGKQLFGEFVDYLFKLKKEHKCAKKYLNTLWGKLTQTNTIKMKTENIYEGREVMSILPTDEGELIFETVIKQKFYETNFARIKPFLLSYGRVKICNIILTNLDEVVRVHTDGIICKSKITNVELGNDIGMLKFEGEGNVKILNNNNYIWEEIKKIE